MSSLPVISATPCATCHGPCCVGRAVVVSAFDLCRLSDALGLPWQELAVVGVAFSGGFRLDASATRWRFQLRQRPGGRCLFALDGEMTRCSVHATRPSACRVYPLYVGLGDDGPAVALGSDALCPAPEAAQWSRLAAPARVEAEVAEHHRYQALLERWEAQLDGQRDAGELVRLAREAL